MQDDVVPEVDLDFKRKETRVVEQGGGTVWHWEKVDATRSGTSGDLAKMFKNEAVKQPGIMAEGAPPAAATLLARELIQNSWDAARELQTDFKIANKTAPDFEIRFEFRDLTGSLKQEVIKSLGLAELASRLDGLNRREVGLAEADCLTSLDEAKPLPILVVAESGTTGMYGPFRGASSKLYLALVSLGFTIKQSGAGGSYGYGKAGLIRGSATRTVVAYSCFQERSKEDPGVTRRLLGMTYWGEHVLEPDGTNYTGFARFGKETGPDAVVPFENEEADAVAQKLGIQRRDPSIPEDLGTTFLLVDPTADPGSVNIAIERNWWPAIDDGKFHAEVVASDGEVLIPRPKRDPALRAFTRAYELATVKQDASSRFERSLDLGPYAPEHSDQLQLGRLGLIGDTEDEKWSYPSDGIDHRSLVALVRGPRMVVEYFDAGRHPPYVRGVVVVDDDVTDELLRQTEPKAHDAWQRHVEEEGVDSRAPKVARTLLAKVSLEVNRFRDLLKPPVPRPDELRLPVMEDLFKRLLAGRGSNRKGPEHVARLLSIQVKDQKVEVAPGSSGSEIRLTGRVLYRLSENYTKADEVDAELGIRYVFVEDDRSGERCELKITAPAGFAASSQDGVFFGRLGRDQIEFLVESVPYESDWTGRLVATGRIGLSSDSDEGLASSDDSDGVE